MGGSAEMSTASTSEASARASAQWNGAGTLFTPRLTTVVFCFSTFVDPGNFASGFRGASAATLTLHCAGFASDHSTVRTVTTADGSGNLSSAPHRAAGGAGAARSPAPWAIL